MLIDRATLSTLRAIAIVFGGGAVLAALAWCTPGSPVVLWRADAAAAQGASNQAIALYDDVGANGWWGGLRRRGLRRAAALMSTELDDPNGALGRIEVLLSITTDAADRARLRTRQGHLHLARRDPASAASAFVAAVRADPSGASAGDRMVLAARTHAEAGHGDEAAVLWASLAEQFPTHRATARLAQAREALQQDRTERALSLFDQAAVAARAAGQPDQAAAARLGLATSLERLGNLDEAIAEIDTAELPNGVRSRRMDGLMQRRELRQR